MSNAVGNNNWGYTGQVAQSNGGGYYSVLDMRRAAQGPGRVPYAEYPDGYLGNSNSRQQDKLLNTMQGRLTERSYQRGVHKGDRIDPQDYHWNDAIDPQAGIRAEARGLKWTALGETPKQLVHYGKSDLLSPQQLADVANGLGLNSGANVLDPVRSAKFQSLLPTWR